MGEDDPYFKISPEQNLQLHDHDELLDRLLYIYIYIGLRFICNSK